MNEYGLWPQPRGKKKMTHSRTFRLSVSAIGATILVSLLLFASGLISPNWVSSKDSQTSLQDVEIYLCLEGDQGILPACPIFSQEPAATVTPTADPEVSNKPSRDFEPEPRVATPAEIAQAALEGQAEAFRVHGFNESCIQEMLAYGRMCIEQCVTADSGFSLGVTLYHPNCSVVSCACDAEPAS